MSWVRGIIELYMPDEICRQNGKSLRGRFRLSLAVYLVAANRGPGGQGTGQRRACSGVVVIYFRARQVIENNGSYVRSTKCDIIFVGRGKWVVATAQIQQERSSTNTLFFCPQLLLQCLCKVLSPAPVLCGR